MPKELKDITSIGRMFFFVCATLVLFCSSVSSAGSELFPPPNVSCACSQDVLTFTCRVDGIGVTIWRGSAFNCPSQNNDITLLHSGYTSGTSSGFCEEGGTRLTAIGLQNVTNNQYTSQLTVPVSASLNGESVECAHNDGQRTTTVDVSTITVVSDLSNSSVFVRLTSVSPDQLTFEWRPVCPSIQYNIITSNCGNCVYNNRQNNASCSTPQLSNTAIVCTFSIQSTACGNSFNDSVVATLKVPSIPETTFVPHYDISRDLKRLTLAITEESTFVIADGINSSILFYTVMFSEDSAGDRCTTSKNVSDFTCVDRVCNLVIELPLSPCPFSAEVINVSVSATNQLGGGPYSDGITIGGKNDFVDVRFSSTNDNIMVECSFLDQQDFSRKSCSILYGPDPQMLIWTANSSSTTSVVSLSLNKISEVQEEKVIFYIITASNGSFTLKVEGNQNLGFRSTNVAAVITGTIFGLLFLTIIITVSIVVVVVVVLKLRSKSANITNEEGIQLDMYREETLSSSTEVVKKTKNDGSGYLVNKTEETKLAEPEMAHPPRFEIVKVEKDCELCEFIEKRCGLVFKRGCAFFEFTHEIEDISEAKEVVLMKKSTGEIVTDPDACRKIGAPGPGIAVKRPHLSKYTVFVQSRGTGARHLNANSSVLYEKPTSIEPQDAGTLLMPVLKRRVQPIQLKESLTFDAMCKKYNEGFSKKNEYYIELAIMKKMKKDRDVYDVIFLDKESGELFTGPKAKEIAEKQLKKYWSNKMEEHVEETGELSSVPNSKEDKIDLEGPVEVQVSSDHVKNKKRMVTIFVCCKFPSDLDLSEDTIVLLKDPCHTPKTLIPLTVVKDCVQMSELIKAAGYEFENGKAYYEFVREEEDIFDDTDIVLMERDTEEKGPVLFTGPDARYQIPGAPGFGIKAPKLKKYRVFVQSKSQGSRCLRAGTSVLYSTCR